MSTRRKFLTTVGATSVGLMFASILSRPTTAKEVDVPPATHPIRYRGPRLNFVGGSSMSAVNQAIVGHVASHPMRQVTAVGDHALLDDLSRLPVEPTWRLSLIGTGSDVSPEEAHRGLLTALRNDPDELIFQVPETRFLGVSLSGVPRDQLNIGWETGHHVTCGILAASVEHMHSQVSVLINAWPYGIESPYVESIDVAFDGNETSSIFRRDFLADPSSRIHWAQAA